MPAKAKKSNAASWPQHSRRKPQHAVMLQMIHLGDNSIHRPVCFYQRLVIIKHVTIIQSANQRQLNVILPSMYSAQVEISQRWPVINSKPQEKNTLKCVFGLNTWKLQRGSTGQTTHARFVRSHRRDHHGDTKGGSKPWPTNGKQKPNI